MTRSHGEFELRDHTADIALWVRAPSMDALFVTAAEGLYAAIGELKCGAIGNRETVALRSADAEGLLHDFLSELLYRFEIRHQRLASFAIERLDDTTLQFSADVHAVDMDTSIMDREVKAVTYHDLRIEESATGFEVTLILDI